MSLVAPEARGSRGDESATCGSLWRRGNARTLFGALLLLWLLYPFAVSGDMAQDATPMLVADRLAGAEPDALYPGAGGIHRPRPSFEAASCDYYEDVARCDRYAVSFISPPTALAVIALAPDSPAAGLLAFRVVGAAALVLAMVALWRRVVGPSSRAAWSMVAAALLVTPLATYTLDLGQTTPLLVLAAAMSLAAASRTRGSGWRLGSVLAVATAFKGFPLVLLLVPAARREWCPVVWTATVVAGLTLVALWMAPVSLWSDFVDTARATGPQADLNPHNSSLGAVLARAGLGWPPLVWLFRAGVLAAIVTCRRSLREADVQWAVAWVTVLVLFPQVWGHYSLIGLAAVGTVVAHRNTPRTVLAVPITAALLVPVAFVDAGGAVDGALRLVVNVLVFGLVLLVATRSPAMAVDEPQEAQRGMDVCLNSLRSVQANRSRIRATVA